MTEYCLVPVTIAEKYMYKENDSLTSTSTPTPTTTTATATTGIRPPVSLPHLNNPSIDHLIRTTVPPVYREYGISLVNLLDGKPNIAWDERGNFLPPFSGLNVMRLITTLANPKAAFSKQEKPLVTMLLRLAQISPNVIKSSRQKKSLTGGTWVAY